MWQATPPSDKTVNLVGQVSTSSIAWGRKEEVSKIAKKIAPDLVAFLHLFAAGELDMSPDYPDPAFSVLTPVTTVKIDCAGSALDAITLIALFEQSIFSQIAYHKPGDMGSEEVVEPGGRCPFFEGHGQSSSQSSDFARYRPHVN